MRETHLAIYEVELPEIAHEVLGSFAVAPRRIMAKPRFVVDLVDEGDRGMTRYVEMDIREDRRDVRNPTRSGQSKPRSPRVGPEGEVVEVPMQVYLAGSKELHGPNAGQQLRRCSRESELFEGAIEPERFNSAQRQRSTGSGNRLPDC